MLLDGYEVGERLGADRMGRAAFQLLKPRLPTQLESAVNIAIGHGHRQHGGQ